MAAKKKAAKKKPAAKSAALPCGNVNNKRQCRPAGPCPKTLAAMCEEMRQYMRCMCEWGFDVTEKIDALKVRLDKCCPGPGPNGVPKPPPPPF